MRIARLFLLPTQLTANGLKPEHVTITKPALLHIATRYTWEAGVRNLERAATGGVVRYKDVEWAEYLDESGDPNIVHLAEVGAGADNQNADTDKPSQCP